MSKQTYFYAVSAVFIIVAVLHLVRALSGWELMLGGAEIPMWVSWAVVIITGYLAYRGVRFGRNM